MEGWRLPDALHENCSQALDSFAPPRPLKGSEPASECTAWAKKCLLRNANYRSASAVAHSIKWLQFNGFNSSRLTDSRNTVPIFRPSRRALPFFQTLPSLSPHPASVHTVTYIFVAVATNISFWQKCLTTFFIAGFSSHVDFLHRNCRDFLQGLSEQKLRRLSAQTFCDRAGNEAISRYDGTNFWSIT